MVKKVKKNAAAAEPKPTQAVEPFAAIVEPSTNVKSVEEKPKPAAKSAAVKTSTVKKAVKVSGKASGIDPFAETVDAVSPARMPAVSTPKKPVKPVTAKAAAVKKPVVATSTVAKKVSASKPATSKSVDAVKPAKKVSNKTVKTAAAGIETATLDATAEIAAAGPQVELSTAFKLLAEPTLPALPRRNRARLQMQTPTRIYFYWSLKQDPWTTLRSVFGNDTGSYTLVIKLVDSTSGREEIRQADAEGNYWFDVEPDRVFQAEIGFYAPNRPYFRILHSNSVETPRRSPSPRAATDSDWKVSSAKFAEVLDVAGFSRDAADVAMAGDDPVVSASRTQLAFTSFIGNAAWQPTGVTAEELRFAMLALASGITLEELKFQVSSELFAILQANAGSVGSTRARNALTEYFEIDDAEFVEDQLGPAVFGASLVNFPRTLRTRTLTPKYAPVSSSR